MTYLYFALTFFFAGLVPELTGFGVATVSMPILSLLLPLKLAIPLVAIISMVVTGIVAFQNKVTGMNRRLAALVGGTAIGVPLGMLFLDFINEETLAVIFGGFLIVYALYGLLTHANTLPDTGIMGSLVGVIAGFFGAVFNIHGPFVGLYSASTQKNDKQEIKGLIATYMFLSGILTVAGHIFYGRIDTEVLYYALFSLPFLFLGLSVGTAFSKKLKATRIKQGIYLFVLAAGVALLL